MGKEDLNKPILLVFIILICCIQRGAGVATYPTANTYCTSSTANIDFSISFNAGETVILTRTWYFGSAMIAESDGTTLTPVPSYLPRLTAYGMYGISLSNVTVADAGNYTYVGTSSTTFNPFTATFTLSIQVAPTTGCSPLGSQSGSKVKCTMDTASGKCGTAPIYTDWLNETGISSTFECDKEKRYTCCGVADSQSSCSWNPNEFCVMYTCTAATTTTMAPTTTMATTMTTTLNIILTLSGTQTFSSITSSNTQTFSATTLSNTQTVSTQNSSVTTSSSSDTQTFPVIPVVIGFAVLILLIIIIITCRCCYLYRHKKEIRTKQQYESELEDSKNPTIPKDGTPNPAYQF